MKCTSNVESFTHDHRYTGFISTEGEDSSVYTKVSSALEDFCGSSQSSTIDSSDDEKSDEPPTKHQRQDNLRGDRSSWPTPVLLLSHPTPNRQMVEEAHKLG